MSARGATACRVVLVLCNTFFLASGVALVVLSALLLSDTERVLLSRLLLLSPEAQKSYYPPFYYAALAIGCAGLAGCSTALLGCWGACQKSKALLGTLIGLLAILLLGQAGLVILLSTLPVGRTLIGVGGILEAKTLTEVLQVNFGSPGHELFTAAYDLAQFKFKCCGALGPNDYEASWWRMQELGSREMRVPLTCCYLNNSPGDERAFLDPVPHNNTVCQLPNQKDNKAERFQQGCLQPLEQWFTTQWTYAAGIIGILIGLQLSVFFSSISLCRRMPSKRQARASSS